MAFDQQKAQRIWVTVGKVPRGKVAGYALIADLAGLPGRARLVGKVMQYAPETMNVPWFRIIRSNGQIAFPVDSMMAKKQSELLQAEGVEIHNNRINMKQFGWQPQLGDLMEMEF